MLLVTYLSLAATSNKMLKILQMAVRVVKGMDLRLNEIKLSI